MRRPFTGAWIETLVIAVSICMPAVAPSRGRGLKPKALCHRRKNTGGRPFTGAWIETIMPSLIQPMRAGRPFTGAWIET